LSIVSIAAKSGLRFRRSHWEDSGMILLLLLTIGVVLQRAAERR